MQEALSFKPWTPPIQQPSNFLRSPPQPMTKTDHHQTRTNSNPINNVEFPTIPSSSSSNNPKGHVREMVSENAVIVVGRRGCCMSHVIKRLLHGLGVNPAVYEIEEEGEASVVRELETVIDDGSGGGQVLQFPAVFIGGRLFGGLDRIMATHITGELTPILKEAGALWL